MISLPLGEGAREDTIGGTTAPGAGSGEFTGLAYTPRYTVSIDTFVYTRLYIVGALDFRAV